MSNYTEAEIAETLKKIEDPIDLGLLFVLYGSELLGTEPLTSSQINDILGFPRPGTAEKRLSRLEASGLIKSVAYYPKGHFLEYEQTGYWVTPPFRQAMVESRLDEVLRKILE